MTNSRFSVRVGDDGRHVYDGDSICQAIDAAKELSLTGSLRKAQIREGSFWLATYRDGVLDRSDRDFDALAGGLS